MVEEHAIDLPAAARDEKNGSFCRNCNARLTGDFCAACGQKEREVRRPFIVLTSELLHTVLELDGRAYRTLFLLLTHPGYLSTEYVKGRRASYTPPLRLFLVLSILLFFLVSVGGTLNSIANSVNGDGEGRAERRNEIARELEGNEDLQAALASIDSPEQAAAIRQALEDIDTAGIIEAESIRESIERGERTAEIRQALQENEEVQAIRQFVSELNFPFLSPQASERLASFLDSQIEENGTEIAEDPAGFFFESLDYITVFILLMMPFMAVITSILYVFKRRYFIEHLILTVHNHSFLMLCFLLLLPLNLMQASEIETLSGAANILSALLSLWIVIYLFLSLKRFFGQGFFATFFKFGIATFSYSIVLGMGAALFFVLYFLFS